MYKFRLINSFRLSVVIFYFIISFVIGPEPQPQPDWNYKEQDKWSEEKQYEKCSGSGHKQSPINIETKKATVDNSLKIEQKYYNTPFDNFNVKKEEHTVKLYLEPVDRKDITLPYITGSALENQNYTFDQLHFHWGENMRIGSEHTINGKRHSMEMHLVHFNQKYGDFTTAQTHEDGLAVIAVLFQERDNNNTKLEPLRDGVKGLKNAELYYSDDKKTITLNTFLPNNLDEFYQYDGSLTTPPCYETVRWLIYSDVNYIGSDQIHEFRTLVNSKKIVLKNTFRKLQKTNDRRVWISKGMGTRSHYNSLFILLSLALNYLLIGNNKFSLRLN